MLWFQFPFCSFFPSAASVSGLFLPHVLNAPEGRDEQLCGGRVGTGTGGCCREIDMSVSIPASLNVPLCHLSCPASQPQTSLSSRSVLLEEFLSSSSPSQELLPNALPPRLSDLESRDSSFAEWKLHFRGYEMVR